MICDEHRPITDADPRAGNGCWAGPAGGGGGGGSPVAAGADGDPARGSHRHVPACRRGGALGLRPRDLDPEQCLILLREKGQTTRWQPVSPTLMRHLLAHAQERGAPPAGQLLRYRNGAPITHRRYDYLWGRVGRHLPWAAAQGISTHWLRHTTPDLGGSARNCI